MIFVILGSREYQFDRLLKKLDEINSQRDFKLDIFAQIGSSTYIPKSYKYERFLDKDDFDKYQNQATIIISHGGTGALVSSIKKEKKVIGIPRQVKFHEHTDDHQFQIIDMLESQGYIIADRSDDLLYLDELIDKSILPLKKYQNENRILEIINIFLSGKV